MAGEDFLARTISHQAGLMTTALIRNRLPKDALGADASSSRQLPRRSPPSAPNSPSPSSAPGGSARSAGHFGKAAEPIDLSRHAVHIFAEIVDAAVLGRGDCDARRCLAADGADIIDLAAYRSAVPAPKERSQRCARPVV
jgi:hypothetical protein